MWIRFRPLLCSGSMQFLDFFVIRFIKLKQKSISGLERTVHLPYCLKMRGVIEEDWICDLPWFDSHFEWKLVRWEWNACVNFMRNKRMHAWISCARGLEKKMHDLPRVKIDKFEQLTDLHDCWWRPWSKDEIPGRASSSLYWKLSMVLKPSAFSSS